MYAAAGGASLASRRAGQRQRQKKVAQLKSQRGDLLQKPQKQFHNYTDPGGAKQRNALQPPAHHERRHSTSNYLKEPSKARIRESPSISIPVQNHQPSQPLSPCRVPPNHLPIHPSPSIQSQLPQIHIPEGEEGKLERRCSFVRQVEEMERCQEGGVLDRCNHICNFEIKDVPWDNSHTFYTEYDQNAFGSLDYPFSECSQGRAAWQERERGRRCSLSEEARQYRIKQNEAHHRWMKRNRIHDTTYGGSSDEEDFFSVYHQSAAANALLYVGLGTTAIGSVIFFVGTGEKGFKTLELRLIGPTLIACGLLCCLIRVLLCACPSTCFRKRKKTRLKSGCPHTSSKYPLAPQRRDRSDFVALDKASLLTKEQHKKKVCIAPPTHPIPSTSTMDFQEHTAVVVEEDEEERKEKAKPTRPSNIPIIELPDFAEFNLEETRITREESIIELQNLDDLQSITSEESEAASNDHEQQPPSPQPEKPPNNEETSLSVVIESNSRDNDAVKKPNSDCEKQTHSGIVLSPLQLGQ